MKTAVFAHRRDIDGLMSAAIYLRAQPDADVFFVDYGETNIKDFLGALSEESLKAKRIVIADFGLDDHNLTEVVATIKPIVAKGVEVFWLDHHSWSGRSLQEVSRIGVKLIKVDDREACGAELVQRVFAPSDQYSGLLAQMAHRTDFHLELNCVDKVLVCVVDYYNTFEPKLCDQKLGALAKKVASGILVDSQTFSDYLKYLELETAATQELLRNIHVFEVGGLKVAVGFTPDPLSATKACDIIRQNTQSDIQVSVKKRKLSFRRANPQVDCAAIARLFKGGGHDYAAGGELDFEVKDQHTASEALRILKEKIGLLFEKPKPEL